MPAASRGEPGTAIGAPQQTKKRNRYLMHAARAGF
jgi:hypothetical protein